MNRKRTKTMLVKKVTVARMMTGIPKMFGILNDPLDKQVESQLMAKEEKEQRKTDNFWGQDKDLHDRELERKMMAKEDESSLKNEHWNEKNKLHQRWDEEYQRNQWFENRSQFMYKEIERREYLKFVHSSLSSNEVISFVWDKKNDESPHKNIIGNEISLSLPSTIGALHMSIHLDGLQQSKAIVDKASNSFKKTLRRVNNQTTTTSSTDEINNDSLILSQKKKNNTITTSPKDNSSASDDLVLPLNPNETTSSSIIYNQHIAAVDGHENHKWDQDLMLQLAFIGLDDGNKGYLTYEELTKVSYSAAAHALLKFTVFWVQIKKRNWKFFENMYNHRMKTITSTTIITKSSATESIRNKQQHQSHHYPYTNNNNNNNNNNNVIESPGLTMVDWLSAASSIAFEFSVPLRHIRLQSEHMELCSSTTNTTTIASSATPLPHPTQKMVMKKKQGKGLGRGGVSGDPANLFSMLPEREHRCARILHEGDCVWALHLGGALWLPAVIKKVHIAKNNNITAATTTRGNTDTLSHHHHHHQLHTNTTKYCGYTYDLVYPLSERELQKSRIATTSRQLLSLPSQQASHGGEILPRPIDREKNVCSFAFDLVDSSGVGMVPLLRLVECLQSVEFGRIVMTSLALSMIFTEGSFCMNARNGNAGTAQDIPSLLPVFIDTFSSTHQLQHETATSTSTKLLPSNTITSSSSSSGDWISKLDFLEFCNTVVDIKRYSIA